MTFALLGLIVVPLTTVMACRTPGKRANVSTTQRVAAAPLIEPVRGVWVARFHYRYPDDVRTIMANCAKLGFNTVYWQVRGEGTVAYPSQIEPWSREYGHADPGFDPLAIAVAEAHRHGLRIEAWVNVMPGWKGPEPPPADLEPAQLYRAHPEWFIRDASGRAQPLGTVDNKGRASSSFYVILNPCLPAVRAHIAAVVDEIVTYYDVDGVHLDYVRFAWDTTPNARSNFPRDETTLALYRATTGRHPDDDAEAWNAWRANQLTRLVALLRDVVQRKRPGASLTAATWRNPMTGYHEYLQNSVAWLRTGLIDAALPMAYTKDLDALIADIEVYHKLAPHACVVPGLGVYKHDQAVQTRAQVAQCQRWGGNFAVFSYESLYSTHGDRGSSEKTRARKETVRRVRRAALLDGVPPR